MKKLRIVILLLCILVLGAGCGKNKKNSQTSGGIDSEALAKEIANCVYKAEAIDLQLADDEDISSVIAKNGKLYAMISRWDYDDTAVNTEEVMIPEARNFEEASEDEMPEGAEVAEDVEAPAEDEDAEVPAPDADSEASEADEEGNVVNDKVATTSEVLDGTMVDVMPDTGEYYDEMTGTLTMTVKCSDGQGNILYTSVKEYDLNNSFYMMDVDSEGNVYYILNSYGSQDGDYQENYYVVCIDTKGEEKWVCQLDTKVTGDEYFYPQYLLPGENGVTVVSTVGVETVSKDGKSEGLKKVGELNNVGSLFALKDGQIAAMVYGDTDAEIKTIDVESGKMGGKVEIPFDVYYYNYYTGAPTYDMILSSNDGLYYYNLGDAAPTKFMDYVGSDLTTTYISQPTMLDANTFYGTFYDDLTENYGLYKFTKVDPTTVINKKIISIGGLWIDSNLRNSVVKYNKSNDDYRIILKDYSNNGNYEDYDELIKSVNNDIVTGNMPDIMIIDSSFDLNNYLSKGVFEPIDSYVENDSDIKWDDYYTNVFEAVRHGGKTYAVIPSFSVSTLIGKTSSLDGKTGWNVKEFVDFFNSKGNDIQPLTYVTKQGFIESMLYYVGEDFIDKETNKATFDSQEFIDLLKFADRFPMEIDYSNLDEDYWEEQEASYRNNKTLLYSGNIYNFRDFIGTLQGTFGEPVTYIGYPTSNGNGSSIYPEMCLAINAKSKNKDAAWGFLRNTLLDEYQENSVYNFPVKKSALDKMAQDAMKPNTYIDDDGNEVEYNDTYYIGGMEVEIKPATQQQIDQVIDVLSSTTKLSNYSADIITIVNEETQSFFNGQKSAEEVAKIINGRVQIYVNENR